MGFEKFPTLFDVPQASGFTRQGSYKSCEYSKQSYEQYLLPIEKQVGIQSRMLSGNLLQYLPPYYSKKWNSVIGRISGDAGMLRVFSDLPIPNDGKRLLIQPIARITKQTDKLYASLYVLNIPNDLQGRYTTADKSRVYKETITKALEFFKSLGMYLLLFNKNVSGILCTSELDITDIQLIDKNNRNKFDRLVLTNDSHRPKLCKHEQTLQQIKIILNT